ncbi:MAG: ISL3 family transposase, partial [Desulfocapsa sp.]|nr:ISL3 family transposase [Desulfocapsa sp.]
MPVKTIASFVDEHDTRLWRIVHHYVDKGRLEADYSKVKEVGFDETSSKRGHNYVSLFVDLEGPRVLFATEGKDSSTVERFKQDLVEHNGCAENIEQMCCDMSPAFIKGVREQFPDTGLTFDKFHIMKIINEAVDEVRRQEQKDRPELARSRYAWLKNPENLKQSQVNIIEKLTVKKLNVGMHLTQAHTICCMVTISRILQPGWLFAHGFLVSLRAVPQLPVEANG